MTAWLPRAVFWFAETDSLRRVLWFEPIIGAYAIDMDLPGAFPVLIQSAVLNDLLAQDLVGPRPDPYASPPAEQGISYKSRLKRAERWSIIQPLIEQAPDIFIRELRGPLVSSRAAQTGTTTRDIYRDLRRYWIRGMTEQAITPDYRNCGAPGRAKVAGITPLGRPGYDPTFIVTPEDENLFQRVIKQTYEKDKRFSITDAYIKLILDHFSRRVPDNFGGTKPEAIDPHPSLRQFRRVLQKKNDQYILKVRREGHSNTEKDNRAILGTSISQTLGPGSRFEIDATLGNFRLRSRTSRRLIGRPVVYFVVDVFSRLIVGFYVGFEWASWPGAMQALAHVVCDKVEFCRKYDIHITKEQWPSGFLPEVILGDGGEVAGPKIDILLSRFNVVSETAKPGRGDQKGSVEQQFALAPEKIKPFVGGWIDPEARGPVPKHERDGEYDIDGFIKAMIQSVMYFNTEHQLVGFKGRPPDMIADGIPAVPLDMFNWGLRNRSGRLRHFDYDYVRLSLLRVVEGKITASGFEVLGLFYTCEPSMRGRLFENARQHGISKVRFSVDDTFVDEVFWHSGDARGEFVPCQLAPSCAEYAGMTRYEVDNISKKNNDIALFNRRRDLNGRLSMTDRLIDIQEEQQAIAEKLPDMPLAMRDANVRENRKLEKNQEDHRKRKGAATEQISHKTDILLKKYKIPPISKIIPRS